MTADNHGGTAPRPAGSAVALGQGSGRTGARGRAGTRPGRSRRPRRWALIAGAVMFATSAGLLAAVFAAARSDLWAMLDLHVYLWGGKLTWRTGSPYQRLYRDFHLYFTYPPMAAGLFAILQRLTVPVVQWLVTVASVVSLTVILWLTWGQLGHRRAASRLAATLALAAVTLWIEPVQQTLAFGQVNLVLMLVIVADLCQPDSRWWKGTGVGLAAGFKLTPLIFVPYLLLTRRFRAAAVAVVTFGVTIAGSFALLPRAARQFWLGGLFLDSNRVGNVDYAGNQSLQGAAGRLLGDTAAAHPYWLVNVAVVGAAGLGLAALLSRRGQEMAGILTCALTGLLVSPVSWSHHWVWVAPMLAAVAESAMRLAARNPGRWWRQAGWAAPAVILALFFAYPFHLAPGAPLVPEGLLWTLPSPALQGSGMTGLQQVTGNLYVLAGLAGLCLIGGCLAVARDPAADPRDGRLPPEPGGAHAPAG